MTFTVVNDLSTDLDKVRFLIGDTDSADQLLQDETINGVLAIQAQVGYAAAVCADMIAAKYARQVNTSNSRLSVSAAERYQHFKDLAKDLRKRAANPFSGSKSLPTNTKVGGRLKSERNSMDDATDTIQPTFKRNRNDNPGYYSDDSSDYWDR